MIKSRFQEPRVLKVLQLIPTLDRSGAEKQMVLLARGLPRDRFQVEVAALTRLGPLEAELQAAGVPITAIRKRHKADPFALLRLVQFLRSRRFDVVQTWLFAANTYGRLAARMANVPIVIATEMAADLWKTRTHLAIDRRLARITDRVVGNSQAVAEFYRAAGVAPERLTVIPSGIPIEEPQQVDGREIRASLGLPTDCPLILYAGRLAPQKGVADLLSAADLLQHVQPELRFLIAGDGPLRDQLEDLAHTFELDTMVRFLGHRDDVPTLLAAADLLVLPSLYEGLPNVVLEAMLYRKPVVATAAPGTTELVVDGQTGLLVPLEQPPALAEAIRKVICDCELAHRFGVNGRERVESQFRADTMVNQFAELYETIAHQKAR
jgi:glycosyltransferase involved in cell wall biosynthesis